MELIKVINARGVINAHRQDNVKFSTAYKFVSFIKQTETQNEFYASQVRELLDKYAKKDEKGDFVRSENGDIVLSPESVKDWNEGIQKLEATTVDVPDIYFTPEELEDIKLSALDVVALGDFLKTE